MSTTKICRNCKYFKPDKTTGADSMLYFGKCMHPKAQTVNIVTGDVSYKLAKYYREDNTIISRNIEQCGPEGKYYEEERNMMIKFYREFYMPLHIYYSILVLLCIYILCRF
jgi:hypothetical protein